MSSISSNLNEGNKPSHFKFRNAELFCRKIQFYEMSLNQVKTEVFVESKKNQRGAYKTWRRRMGKKK